MSDTSRRDLLKVATAGIVGSAATYAYVSSRAENNDHRTNDGDRQRPTDSSGREGVYYVAPEEGVEGIQRIVSEHAPNVTVVLGRGRYTGSGLTLRNDVRLVGVAPNATILRLADGADTDLVVSPNPDERSSLRVRFEGVTFDGNGENNEDGNLVYGAFWNSRFVDCEFVNAPANGFWLAGSSDGSTDDNVFLNCRFAHCRAVGLRLGANRSTGTAVGVARVDTCWFGNNGGHGVRIRGNGNYVTDGKFYGNTGSDVFVDRGSRNQILTNDMSKPNPTAPCVSLLASKGVNSSGNRVAGNVLFGSFADGVFCRANGNEISGLQIHGNVFTGNGTGNESAIRAIGGPYEECSARDNTITGTYRGSAITVPSSWATSGNSE